MCVCVCAHIYIYKYYYHPCQNQSFKKVAHLIQVLSKPFFIKDVLYYNTIDGFSLPFGELEIKNPGIVSSIVKVQEKSEINLYVLKKCSVKASQPLPPSVILASS